MGGGERERDGENVLESTTKVSHLARYTVRAQVSNLFNFQHSLYGSLLSYLMGTSWQRGSFVDLYIQFTQLM